MIRRIYNHCWKEMKSIIKEETKDNKKNKKEKIKNKIKEIKNILKELIYILLLIFLFLLLFLCTMGLTIVPIIIGRLIHPIFYLIEIIAIPVMFLIIIVMSQND